MKDTIQKLNDVLGHLTAMSFIRPETSEDLVKPLNDLSEAVSEFENLSLCAVGNTLTVKEISEIGIYDMEMAQIRELIDRIEKQLLIHGVVVPKGTLLLNKLKDGIDEYLDGQRNHIIERNPERMRTIEAVAYHCKRIAEDLTK